MSIWPSDMRAFSPEVDQAGDTSPRIPSASLPITEPPLTSSSTLTTSVSTPRLVTPPPSSAMSQPGPSTSGISLSQSPPSSMTNIPKRLPSTPFRRSSGSSSDISLVHSSNLNAIQERRGIEVEDMTDPSETNSVAELPDSPLLEPPRTRRRLSLEPSHNLATYRHPSFFAPHRPVLPRVDPEPAHLAAFEQRTARGHGIHELGMFNHSGSPYRPRLTSRHESGSSSSTRAESSAVPLTNTRRHAPTPVPILISPNQLGAQHRSRLDGSTETDLAIPSNDIDRLIDLEATVPPPRPSGHMSSGFFDVPSYTSPTRHRYTEDGIPGILQSAAPTMSRSTSVGTAFRNRALSDRLQRLDALRTQTDFRPRAAGYPVNGLGGDVFPSSDTEAQSIDTMDLDELDPLTSTSGDSSRQAGSSSAMTSGDSSDIGRWNQSVQEAVGRRVSAERPRSPASTRRYRDGVGPYSGTRQPRAAREGSETTAESSRNQYQALRALWGEVPFPIDTASSGLHDIHYPFSSARPLPPTMSADSFSRRVRLQRAFERPERRVGDIENNLEDHLPSDARPRGEYGDFLQSRNDRDTEETFLSGISRYRDPRVMDSSSIDPHPAPPQFGAGTWQSYPYYRWNILGGRPVPVSDPQVAAPPQEARFHHHHQPHRHYHLWLSQFHFRDDMTESERLMVAKAVSRCISRSPGDYRRQAAEAMIEHVPRGDIGERQGMEIDHSCSICHDDVSFSSYGRGMAG